MNPPPPMPKTEMIERSLSCFKWGLLGLLPVIGIPMAVMSLAQYRRVKRGRGAMWNPAERHLFLGAMCARAGIWPILIAVVVITLGVYLGVF
jgi:hypothetical protein